MVIDRARLEEIINDWMDTDETGYTLADRIEEFIQEFIKGMIGGMQLFGTDEAAVERLKKSGWLERHDAEVERRVSVNELINTVMARGDKSIRISIDPWRWED